VQLCRRGAQALIGQAAKVFLLHNPAKILPKPSVAHSESLLTRSVDTYKKRDCIEKWARVCDVSNCEQVNRLDVGITMSMLMGNGRRDIYHDLVTQ
jgi:hypothetical protein